MQDTDAANTMSMVLLSVVAVLLFSENRLAAGLLWVGCASLGAEQCLSSRSNNGQVMSRGTISSSQITLAGWGMVIALLVDEWKFRVVGLIVILSSSVGMMISFWPSFATNTNVPEESNEGGVRSTIPRVQEVHEVARTNENDEQEPLLGDADESNQENEDDEEAGAAYHLMEEDDENNDATPTPDDPPPNSSRIRGTRRLLQLAKPQLVYLYAGCLVLFVRLPCSLAMPHFVSTTLTAIADLDFHEARSQIMFLFITGTIDAVLDFWGFFLFGYANQRIVKDLRIGLFRRLLGQEVAFFDQNSSGHLSSRLNSDCSEMAGDLTWFFRFSIESVVRITGITCYMMVRSYRLGLCALSIVPVVALINKLYGEWLRRNAATVQDALAGANATAQEALTNIRTVVAFCGEQQECSKYENRIDHQYELNVKQLFLTALYYMVVSTFLINTVVQGSLLYLGMRLIEHHGLSPGVLLAFMLYQSQLQNEVLSLMNSYTSLIKSSGAGDKVFALLDRSPPPPATGFLPEEPEVHPSVPCHSVSLQNVSFRYPGRPENLILSELSLDIPQGQTVALVGRSGGGKSTIVNLIQRFYDPTLGRLLIDGVDLRELDILEHRRRLGVVTQEPSLVSGTLWENITYGSPDATEEEVHKAAQLANAESFILSFPDGYNTAVGERGVQLSGGQKQRIAIARAIVKQPSMLLLDEATASLDSESEDAVQRALDNLMGQQSLTVVVVAHRLRTVRNADCIVVLQDGVVAESGTHGELLKRKDGIYKSMVERGTEIVAAE